MSARNFSKFGGSLLEGAVGKIKPKKASTKEAKHI
jgi:hypothetical protein